MPILHTFESLKEEIKLLEIKQVENEKQLRLQFINVYENLKPINILKNIVKDISSNDNLKNEAANTLAGLVSGFISKKIIVGRSKNPFLKLFGIGIQFGITTLVSTKYNAVKDYVVNYINQIQERRDSVD